MIFCFLGRYGVAKKKLRKIENVNSASKDNIRSHLSAKRLNHGNSLQKDQTTPLKVPKLLQINKKTPPKVPKSLQFDEKTPSHSHSSSSSPHPHRIPIIIRSMSSPKTPSCHRQFLNFDETGEQISPLKTPYSSTLTSNFSPILEQTKEHGNDRIRCTPRKKYSSAQSAISDSCHEMLKLLVQSSRKQGKFHKETS